MSCGASTTMNCQPPDPQLHQFPTYPNAIGIVPASHFGLLSLKSFGIESFLCPPNSSLSSFVHAVPLAWYAFPTLTPATFTLLLETNSHHLPQKASPGWALKTSRALVLTLFHESPVSLSSSFNLWSIWRRRQCAYLVLSSCPTPETKQAHFMWNEWMWELIKKERTSQRSLGEYLLGL